MRAAAARAYCTFPHTDASLSKAFISTAERQSAAAVQPPSSSHHPSGIRVVTQDLGGATSSVAFWVDCGAVYETADEAGVSAALAEMMFKSNLQSSDYHMFKTFQHAACNYHTCQVGKRWVGMKVECRRDIVGDMMKHLVEGMFVPRFAPHELSMLREKLESKAATLEHDAAAFARMQAVSTAFSGSPLANPDYVPEYNVDNLTSTDIINWWAQHFSPSRIILAGVNVSSSMLTAAFEEAEYSNCAANNPSHAGVTVPSLSPQQGMYSGGQFRKFVRATEKFATQRFYDDVHVVYARRGFGRQNVKDYATTLVAAGSVGGVPAARCGRYGFSECYDSVGLVGGQLRCRPGDAAAQVKQMAEAVNAAGSLAGEGLASARKRAAVSFMSTVESRDGLLDFFALHSNAGGLAVQPDEVLDAIASVTEADMKRVAEYMKALPPTLVAYGDLSATPALQAL
eukprot:TRINITY_DN636_c7_g1_i1.p1 TRINITY_DN636_c7_g1~~TRINITY_DN636_c7_g1_i1.p1  ORF type:complete len:496 (+),score=204.39 TRINITY_DN636_c7_g1_i1:122-1489(+)